VKKRLDSEEALVCIDAATKQAINLFDRKGDYSVSYLRCIIQIAKENLEKEFNYPVNEYSDWYIVKCKMTEEEARQSEMEHRVFQITENRKIISLFTEELKKREELTMDEIYNHLKNKYYLCVSKDKSESDSYMKGVYVGMARAYQDICQLLKVNLWRTRNN